MKYRRHINIHFRDIARLREFLQDRDLRVNIDWDSVSQSGVGISGRMNISIPGRGTLRGEISEQNAKDLDTLITELENGYCVHF
jgi:hypothetical protein